VSGRSAADERRSIVRELTCRYADPPAQALAGVSLDAAPASSSR
jgi:hypothetical protein